jgi:hypothetical protein
MKKDLKDLNVRELSYKEMYLTNGGGIGFYWLGQVVGFIKNAVDAVSNAWTSTPEGHAAQQALQDFQ